MAKQPCNQPRCELPKWGLKHSCVWHWLMTQSGDVQFAAAVRRRAAAARQPGYVEQPRVAADHWPEGRRWCAGCQTFVPLFYCTGSRCKGCAGMAAYLSHVRRTYDVSADAYLALFAYQDGRCYVCGKLPKKRRLAVDHDHVTGEVRGLLCSGDEWGCNRVLAVVLNDVDMARRLLEYVECPPMERMKNAC